MKIRQLRRTLKYTFFLSVFLLLGLSGVSQAADDPAKIAPVISSTPAFPEFTAIPDNIEIEVVEIKSEQAIVEKFVDSLEITLKNGKSFAINAPTPEDREAYDLMTDEQKEKFLAKRIRFLTRIARVLNSTRFAFGTGLLIGDKISFIKTKFKKKTPTEEVPISPEESKTFSEKSVIAVQQILNAVDKQLWEQSALVAKSNEFGVSASLSFIAEAGIRSKGFGGVQELGVSFSTNVETKALVFEIYHNSESFKSSLATVGILAGVIKAGVMINQRSAGPEGNTFKGLTYGPPVAPGYISMAKNSFNAGPMLTLGLPPSPFADMMAYTNQFERNTLLRISVSPMVRGFVRIELGNVAGVGRILVSPFTNMFVFVKEKILQIKRPIPSVASCGRAFAT